MRLGRLVEEERPGVARAARGSSPRPRARRAARAARRTARRRGSRPAAGPPTDGGRVSRPTVSPARRGSGSGAAARTDHIVATSDTVVAIGPTVSKLGQSGNDAVDRDPPPARLEADDAAARRRQADRAARVGPDPDVAEPGGERRRVAPRRPAGGPAGQARVLHGAVPVVLARHPPGELVQVRLADDDRPRGDEPLHRRGRLHGHMVGVDLRAVGRADPGGVDQVLDEQPPPVQRAGPRRRGLHLGDDRVVRIAHLEPTLTGSAPLPRSRCARPGSRASRSRRVCWPAEPRRTPPGGRCSRRRDRRCR